MKHCAWLLVLVLAACHPLTNVWDPQSPSYGGTLQGMGVLSEAINAASDIRAAIVADNHLYVAAGAAGLWVCDPLDPTTRYSTLSAFPDGTPLRADDVVVSGTDAYVASGGTLVIVDVADPSTPVILGHVVADAEVSAAPSSVRAGTDAAYLLCDQIVYVTDTSSRAAPVVVAEWWGAVGMYTTSGAGYLYLTTTNGTFAIVDVADPANLQTVTNISLPGARGLFVQGTLAYLACSANGLVILDLADPASPANLGSLSGPPSDAYGVLVDGTTAYVADGEYGLRVVDVTDPANPALLGSSSTSMRFSAIQGIWLENSVFYCPENGAVEVFDVSTPATPDLMATLEVSGPSRGIALLDPWALVATDYGLDIVDVATATLMRRVRKDPGTDWLSGGVATYRGGAGSYAYLNGYPDTTIVNVTDPLAADVVGQIPGEAQYIAAGSDWLCTALGDTLTFHDLADPAAPVSAATLTVSGGFVVNMEASVDHLYVMSGDGSGSPILEVVHIDTPATPTVEGSLSIGYGTSVPAMAYDAVAGLYVYERGEQMEVWRVNVDDPAAPYVVGSYSSTTVEAMCFRLGALTCAGEGWMEERDYDIETSGSAVGVLDISSLGVISALTADDERSLLYVTSPATGLTILGF